jgi:hypothetical protein
VSEMIERVAKAICASYGHEWRAGTYPAMTGPNFEMEGLDADRLNNRWRHIAKAAIKAMRNPTEEMCSSGSEAHGVWGFGAADATPVFNAMIDAALSQATPSGGEQQ